MSFARGFWSGPLLPRGVWNEEIVWEKWEASKFTPCRDVFSWFPRSNPAGVSQCFAGFMDRWADSDWQEACWFAVNWYVEANLGSGGVEGAAILSQTALEPLAWAYLVEEKQLYSGKQFNNKMSAADRIRDLLKQASIPGGVPPSSQAVARGFQATDGPELLTAFRNALVHPKRSKRRSVTQLSVDERFDIVNLSQWYVELVRLWLFGYSGTYRSRLRLSGEETTPWAATPGT